ALGATTWGVLGLTVLPRTDAAGALGVPLLLAFLWRSQARAAYAGVFLVVAALELYGTAIGTWRWAAELPGLGIPDGNPPSGVAAGYVWFDVMALMFAPRLLTAVQRTWPLRRRPLAEPAPENCGRGGHFNSAGSYAAGAGPLSFGRANPGRRDSSAGPSAIRLIAPTGTMSSSASPSAADTDNARKPKPGSPERACSGRRSPSASPTTTWTCSAASVAA